MENQEKTAYISFSADINVTTAEHLMGTVFQEISKGANHIYILFSSTGGMVDPGIALYNTLKGINAKLTMHNVGNVDSTANAVFMAGHERFACPHSTFMFHGVKWGFGQGQTLGPSELGELVGNLEALEAKIAGIIHDQTSLVTEEINRFFVEAQTVDSASALAKGIVQGVRDVDLPPGAETVQLVFNR